MSLDLGPYLEFGLSKIKITDITHSCIINGLVRSKNALNIGISLACLDNR